MYFQLMLPGVRDGEELVLMVDGQRHKVMKHTPETLEKAREKNAALAVMDDDKLKDMMFYAEAGSYTHSRAHVTGRNIVCRILLENTKKKKK